MATWNVLITLGTFAASDGARDYGEIEARFPDFKSYAAPYKWSTVESRFLRRDFKTSITNDIDVCARMYDHGCIHYASRVCSFLVRCFISPFILRTERTCLYFSLQFSFKSRVPESSIITGTKLSRRIDSTRRTSITFIVRWCNLTLQPRRDSRRNSARASEICTKRRTLRFWTEIFSHHQSLSRPPANYDRFARISREERKYIFGLSGLFLSLSRSFVDSHRS